MFLDEAYCAENAEVRPGQYVQIAITDNGVGMTQEIATAGLRAVLHHQGGRSRHRLGPQPGLWLRQAIGRPRQNLQRARPRHDGQNLSAARVKQELVGENSRRKIPRRPPPTARKPFCSSKTTPTCARSLPATLEELNYTVLQAGGAASALQVLDRAEQDRSAVDRRDSAGTERPGIGRAPRWQKRPGLKVLFMTGYSRNAIVHQGRLDEGVQLIQKPVTQASLAAKIRDVLDNRSAGLGPAAGKAF